jgi:hypothetical protein
MIYLLSLTYGTGAVVAFVVVPMLRALNRLWVRATSHAEAVFARATEPSEWSQLPEDDPRRQAAERAHAMLRSAPFKGEPTESEHSATEWRPSHSFVSVLVICILGIFHAGPRRPGGD